MPNSEAQRAQILAELSVLSTNIRVTQANLDALSVQQSAVYSSQPVDQSYNPFNYQSNASVQVSSAPQTTSSTLYVEVEAQRSAAISTLQSTLAQYRARRLQLELELADVNSAISRYESEIQNALARKGFLTNKLSEFNIQDNTLAKAKSLDELNRDLASIEAQKKPQQDEKVRLEKEISRNTSQLERIAREISQLNRTLADSAGPAEKYSAITDLVDLESKFAAQENQLVTLQASREGFVRETRQNQEKISANKRKENSLRLRKSELEANGYLQFIQNDPESLRKGLLNSLSTQRVNYERVSPAKQSEAARLFLAEMSSKPSFINELVNQDAQNNKELALKNYYQLCGFVWNALDKLDEKTDVVLIDEVVGIMDQHPLAAKEAKEEYIALQQTYVEPLREMNEKDLLEFEEKSFENAYQKALEVLDTIPIQNGDEFKAFYASGKAVIEEIYTLKLTAKKNHDPEFDIKYCTTVLDQTSQLLLDPSKKILRDNYSELTKFNADGKASLPKKIIGIMQMFLGAAMAIAGIVMLPLGFSAVLGGLTIAAGVSIAGAGVGLFCHGLEKRLEKENGGIA